MDVNHLPWKLPWNLAGQPVFRYGFEPMSRLAARPASAPATSLVADAYRALKDAILAPTRIYVKPILKLLETVPVHALAHITGGGLPGNVPRVLPADSRAVIDARTWQRPAIFDWLQQGGNVASDEMYRTFNCGIGMVLVVAAAQAETVMQQLKAAGESVWRIGSIEAGDGAPRVDMVE